MMLIPLQRLANHRLLNIFDPLLYLNAIMADVVLTLLYLNAIMADAVLIDDLLIFRHRRVDWFDPSTLGTAAIIIAVISVLRYALIPIWTQYVSQYQCFLTILFALILNLVWLMFR